jgi:DNA invertase Pin-like site-specific DNA recombinase
MKQGSIGLCRVSTSKQKETGHSLERQEENVRKSAEELGAPIERWWSHDVSSKVGKNLKRSDLKEMQDYCRKHKHIKYLIVDEVDRFMRDIKYFYYFEAVFEQLGVRVWYASQPELNSDDIAAKMQKLLYVFRAEASNDERSGKSLNGLIERVRLGYHPFPLVPGYMKSDVPGLQPPDPKSFFLLQESVRRILSGQFTVNESCAWVKERGYLTPNGKEFGIDKYKDFLRNPYIAGAVCPKKWDKSLWNWKALHEPMITLEEWERLQPLVDKNKRVFTRQKHNPDFQMSNIMCCDQCGEGRLVGFNHRNGKGWIAGKYRCRKCQAMYWREDVHEGVSQLLDSVELLKEEEDDFIQSLRKVWQENQSDNLRHITLQEGLLEKLLYQKDELVTALAANPDLKEDITASIERKKIEIQKVKCHIEELKDVESDFVEFTKFAMNFMQNKAREWWQLDHSDRVKCKQLLFKQEIFIRRSKKVYTPEISPIFRLVKTKKGSFRDPNLDMVEVARVALASRVSGVGVLHAQAPLVRDSALRADAAATSYRYLSDGDGTCRAHPTGMTFHLPRIGDRVGNGFRS